MLAAVNRPRLTLAIFNEATGWRLPESLVEAVSRAAGNEAEVHSVGSRAELHEALPESDFLAGPALSEDQLARAGGRLRWLQLTSSLGDEGAMLPPLFSAGVRVSGAAGIRAPFLADHAMALLLALVRRLDTAVAAQTDQRWSTGEIVRSLGTLDGRMMGVISVGPVAEEISRRGRAFGLRIASVLPHDEGADGGADEVIPFARWRDLLARCDVLVVASPRTPRTAGLIGRDEFAAMKAGMMLIDVSRGGIVRESALVEALRRGVIGGAGLDAFETEPLPPNSPLWTLPGVIVTPHVASAGPVYWERAAEVIGDNLRRILAREPLIGEVDVSWFEARVEGVGRSAGMR